MHRAKGDQSVSHQPWRPVRDGTSCHYPIDDIFTPPSKDHPHRQRQWFRQEEQTRHADVGSERVGDRRRSAFTISCEESGGHRGGHTPHGDEASVFGAGVQKVYVAIQRGGEGQY